MLSKRTSNLSVVALGAAAVMLGCSASATNYKAEAEKLIVETIAPDIGLGDLKSECEKPAKDSPAVGDTFDCTATTADGDVITLVATVDKPNHINVNTSNLVAKDAAKRLGVAAVGLLEEQLGVTIGAENMDCGTTSLIVDAQAPQIVCGLTNTTSGDVYDATITIDDLANIDEINVVVADSPRP